MYIYSCVFPAVIKSVFRNREVTFLCPFYMNWVYTHLTNLRWRRYFGYIFENYTKGLGIWKLKTETRSKSKDDNLFQINNNREKPIVDHSYDRPQILSNCHLKSVAVFEWIEFWFDMMHQHLIVSTYHF